MRPNAERLALSIADATDREVIYGIRHDVYACELGQHAENDERRLTDALDGCNEYLVARRGDEVAGFVAITPPGAGAYSIDKYFRRDAVSVAFDDGLYEVRLLTVTKAHRKGAAAFLLMHGALRHVAARGGRTIVAMGRAELLDLYRRIGMRPLGLRTTSGRVAYELMAATVGDLQAHVTAFSRTMTRLSRPSGRERAPHEPDMPRACAHGGAFFDAIGDEFETLDRRHHTINADVLDAWFDPAPAVMQALTEHLAFAVRTSPPVHAGGMRRAIARARGVPEAAILPGAGSSALIFAGLCRWVRAGSRVLILDPMYGEYAHVLEHVVGARVDRLTLDPSAEFEVDPRELAARIGRGLDWVVLVNPNSPTGSHVERGELRRIIAEAPPAVRFWIDETYVDYVDPDQSLERDAAQSSRVVVCKSMSKVYALSGVRAAYLCGPPALLADLARVSPPWAVGLPAQMAACAALRSLPYYERRWRETKELRSELFTALQALGWRVFPGCANFLLCELPEHGPTSAEVVHRARTLGLFVRDVQQMGTSLGPRALRVAVKDAATNAAIGRVLREVLTQLGAPTGGVYAIAGQPPVIGARGSAG